MPTQQNIWDADWQPYDSDEDPFSGDWEPTDQAGKLNPWEADWQEEVEEAPTFGGRVKESWETGKKQVAIGQMSFKQLLGDKAPETEQRMQAIEETMPQGPRPSRGLPEQAVRAAAEMAPIPLTGMEQGLKRGTALGLGFGAIATLGGPAAPITVPAAAAAGFSIGMISASLENIGGIEAGLAYREFKDLKDPETGEMMNEGIAKVAGLTVGAINGAIELLQIKTFLRSIPGAEMLVRKGLTESVKRVLKSKSLRAIVFRAAKKYAGGVVTETGQEELQEIVNISGRYMATEVNNALKGTNIPTQTKKEIVDQLLETGKQSALAFSVFMAPGSAVSTTQDIAERRKEAGPGEADLLKAEGEPDKFETSLREGFNTGRINSSYLKEFKSKLPKKHPGHKVIDKLLKESEATTPERDMMTGDVIALEPEEELLPIIPVDQMGEEIPIEPPETAIPMPGAYPPLADVSAQESAQVFEQDRTDRIQAQIEAQRLEDDRAAQEERIRQSSVSKEGLREQVKERGEKAEIEGMEFKVPYIRGLLEQVKGAEAGRRIRVTDYDGTEKWFGVPSEFPAFMKNRYGRKEVVNAIEKGLSGYVFPESEVRQASIWEDVKSEAYQMRNRDLKLAAETYIEEPTAIEGLPDKDYKLLITELQHEGYSTREIEEIAARHRKQIEGRVIASIESEYGFSKEQIEQILSDPLEAVSDLDAAWKEATGTKPVAAYLTPITEAEGYAQEKERRLARSERKGKEPGRAIQQGRGGKEAEAGGIFQEASPDEIEQKGQLIAKLINGNLFPGHKMKYDGVWPGFAPDMPDMYQFTAYAKDSPIFKATVVIHGLEADALKEKLEDTVSKFTKAAPEKEFKEAIDLAADEAETEPTEAQIEANNYKHGHINIQGLEISIENPKGSFREGVSPEGKKWRTKLKHHYGYIKSTIGRDHDQVDVFIGPNPESDKVYVVDQVVPETGRLDEHKCLIGFLSIEDARDGYLGNYEPGWKGIGAITPVSMEAFKVWLKKGTQKKSFAGSPWGWRGRKDASLQESLADRGGFDTNLTSYASDRVPGTIELERPIEIPTERPPSEVSGRKAPTLKRPPDRTPTDAVPIAKGGKRPALPTKPERFIKGPTEAPGLMEPDVSRLTDDFQVVRGIVQAVPIDVMDNLVSRKAPSEDFLHDQTMGKPLLPTPADQKIRATTTVKTSDMATGVRPTHKKPSKSELGAMVGFEKQEVKTKVPVKEVPVVEKPTESIENIFKDPSASQAEVIREKAHLKRQVIEGVKSGKFKGAVRFSTVIDLKKTIEADKLYVSREGVIHATPILNKDDDAFPAYGSYKNHAVAYIIPEKYVKKKPDAHTKEVLIDPGVPLDEITFLVDGQDKEFSNAELVAALGEKELPKAEKPEKKKPVEKAEAKEPLVLTPEKGTPWERQAELEREGAVERPAKDKKVKAAFGEKPVTGAGIVGRQTGLFGLEKGETADMFAEAEEKPKAEPTVDTLEKIRKKAHVGKKAGIEYVAQMEVAETGDIIDVPMDAGTALNEADNRLENYNKLLECIESD